MQEQHDVALPLSENRLVRVRYVAGAVDAKPALQVFKDFFAVVAGQNGAIRRP